VQPHRRRVNANTPNVEAIPAATGGPQYGDDMFSSPHQTNHPQTWGPFARFRGVRLPPPLENPQPIAR
jgi:hypothetical protein